MKKIPLLLTISCLFVLQSCTKNSDPYSEDKNLVVDEAIAIELPEVKVPLVNTITTQKRAIYGGRESISYYEEKFEYDSKNRVTLYDYDNGNFIWTYEYDVGNRVIEIVERTPYSVTTYKYAYYKDRIVATSDRDGYTIYLNNNKRIDRVMPYGSSSQSIYNYDERGNLVTKTFIDSGESPPFGAHTFDDKRNPFTRVAGYNLHFLYIAPVEWVREARGNPNNSTFADKSTGVSLGTKTYVYNKDGYPQMSQTTYPNSDITDYEFYYYTK